MSEAPQPFSIEGTFEALLIGNGKKQTTRIGLYHLNLATAEQLCKLFFKDGSIKGVKDQLKTLTDQGYI